MLFGTTSADLWAAVAGARPGGAVRELRRLAVWLVLVMALAVGGASGAAPVAEDAAYTLEPGRDLTINLAATDADGDALNFVILSPLPALGTVTADGATLAAGDLPYTLAGHGRTLVYEAGADSHGTDTITFQTTDGTDASAEATIALTINRSPEAESTTVFYTMPGTDLKMALPAVDPDGDALTYTITSLPGHGRIKAGAAELTDDDVPFEAESGAVVYSPDAAFHGQDRFTFTARDGQAATGSIAVTIEVNTTPAPSAVTATVLPGGSTTIALAAADADKDPVVCVISSLPDHGVLSVAGRDIQQGDLPFDLVADARTVEYRLEAGYRGTDTFHYRAADAVSISDRAVVTVIVNTPPVAAGSEWTVAAGAVVEGCLTPTDADGDALAVQIARLGTSGTLKLDGKAVSKTGTSYAVPAGGLPFTYTFTDGFSGTDSFAWVASDGVQASAEAEVLLTARAPDSQPADTPDDQTPDGSPDTLDEGDSAGCAPLGGGFLLTATVFGLIIGPGTRHYRRGLARQPI